jgi:hypothetical protein
MVGLRLGSVVVGLPDGLPSVTVSTVIVGALWLELNGWEPDWGGRWWAIHVWDWQLLGWGCQMTFPVSLWA